MGEVIVNDFSSRINKTSNNYPSRRGTSGDEHGKARKERRDPVISYVHVCLSYFWNIVDIVGLILTLLLQGSLINYYLILYNNGTAFWYFWFLLDFAILILFMVSIAFAKKYYAKEGQKTEAIVTEIQKKFRIGKGLLSFTFPDRMGKLPLMYLSWLIYALTLTIKIFIVYKQEIPKHMLKENHRAGPTVIELSIAVSVIVFLLWVEAHRNGDHNKSYVNELTSITVFEIFDSIFFIDLVTPDSNLVRNQLTSNNSNVSNSLETTILLLAAVNFLLPTIQLFGLSKIDFNTTNKSMQQSISGNLVESRSQLAPLIVHSLFQVCKLFLINVPYFFIRIHLAANYDKELSIFIVKNFLGIIISVRSLASQFILWMEIRQEIKAVKRNNPAIRINKTNENNGHGWDLPVIFDQYSNRKPNQSGETRSSRSPEDEGPSGSNDAFVDVNLDAKE